MAHLGWYIQSYNDTETVQKIFAIIQAKNTRHCYGKGIAERIRKSLND